MRAPTFGYNPALDGLRALAVFVVLAEHAKLQAPGGFHGVEVFFVISGYLITSLLFAEYTKTGGIRFGHFYRRRLVRLAAALVVVIAATIVWLLATGHSIAHWWAGAVGGLTYTTDVFSLFPDNASGAPISHYFQYTWSLGIEEQFYLLWPILLLTLVRLERFRATIVVLTVAALTAWLLRWDLVYAQVPQRSIVFGPFTHYDSLLLGCILALVLSRFPVTRGMRIAANIVGPLGVLLLASIILTEVGGSLPTEPALQSLDPYAFGQTALAALAVVFWMAVDPQSLFGRAMAFGPIAYLGKISYSLYLWNILLLWIFVDVAGELPGATPWGFVWLVAVVGVSSLSYHFVETPLRRRWAPPRPHAVVESLPVAE